MLTAKRLTLPAPAKINCFLHILNRRPDGYHNIQTAFQFCDLLDSLTFQRRNDDRIVVHMQGAAISQKENIITRAAQLCRDAANAPLGCDIHCVKHIPIGAGLGGGSSNAATTLRGLNAIWDLGLSQETLLEMALSLGADVPIFIHGYAAWAEGVGEKLTPVPKLPESWLCILDPKQPVATQRIFQHPQLLRDQKPYPLGKMAVNYPNDCELLVAELYPEVGRALNWANQQHFAWLTGTGCAIVTRFETRADAQAFCAKIPPPWRGFVAYASNVSALTSCI